MLLYAIHASRTSASSRRNREIYPLAYYFSWTLMAQLCMARNHFAVGNRSFREGDTLKIMTSTDFVHVTVGTESPRLRLSETRKLPKYENFHVDRVRHGGTLRHGRFVSETELLTHRWREMWIFRSRFWNVEAFFISQIERADVWFCIRFVDVQFSFS